MFSYQLFPKFFQSLTADELMEICQSLNLDAPTALVRDGYWVNDADLAGSLAAFIKTAERHGMTINYAQTGLHMPDLNPDDRTLKTLAAAGIEQARMGMIPKEIVSDYRELPDFFTRAAEKAETAGRACGIRCVIQIHGNLYPHTATAVWQMVKNLNPKYIGVKLDPGNNLTFEGYERFDYQIKLLRDYITAVGVKDTEIGRNPGAATGGKGWWRRFAPITEGLADYDLIVSELLKVGFDGPMVFMPFYEETDTARLMKLLGEEVAYLRGIEKRKREELAL